MSRGTSNLLTIWTPFGENPLEMGALACVESSNQLPRFHHFQVHYIDIIVFEACRMAERLERATHNSQTLLSRVRVLLTVKGRHMFSVV